MGTLVTASTLRTYVFVYAVMAAVCAAPAYAVSREAISFDWLALRADLETVQNTTGNAFALRGGWSPTLQLAQSPVGLRLLVEYGALRTTNAKVFSAPSVQLLAIWSPAPRLEVAAGAGAQFWVAQGADDARLVVSLEAHYVPPRRFLRVFRSGFAAASIGPSSTSGLQARLGVELRFGPEAEGVVDVAPAPGAPVGVPSTAREPAALEKAAPQLACPACPSCPVCPVCPEPKAAHNVVLPTPVLFAFDSSVVPEAGRAYLLQLGSGLAAQQDAWATLALTGHANAVGKAAHNLVLSVARARAVADILQQAGVPEHRLTISGVGATQPVGGSAPTDATQQRVMLEVFGSHVDSRLQALIDGASILPEESHLQ